MDKFVTKTKQMGVTMIEMIIIVAIIALLSVLFLFVYQKQLAKARDAQRKDDLERLKVAFEDYYNDNGCYPPPEVMMDCNQDSLAPYINEIPCDPKTGEFYKFFSLYGNTCRGYKILTNLEIEDDPGIERIGCDFDLGCGWEGHPEYNYGIVMGDGMLSDNWQLGGSPSEGGFQVDRYYCVPGCDNPTGCFGPEDYVYYCNSLSYEVALDYYQCPRSYDSAPGCESECENMIDEETGDPIPTEEWGSQTACEIPSD
jgi:Tfp pilus assembly protein PilE